MQAQMSDKTKMELMMSKPLFTDINQTHLQNVLTTLIQSVEDLEKHRANMDRAVATINQRIDVQTNSIHDLEQQINILGKNISDVKHEKDKDLKPLLWDLDELRKGVGKHRDETDNLRQAVEDIQGDINGKDRKYDSAHAELGHKLEQLKKDHENRDKDVTEAMSSLAGRVDEKIDEAQLLKLLTAQDERIKHNTLGLDTTKGVLANVDEQVKRLTGDLDQLKLTTASRERQLEDDVARLEEDIDQAIKRAQAASDAATRSELERAKQDLQAATRGVEDQLFSMGERLNRQTEDQTKDLERALNDVDRKVRDGLKAVNNDQAAAADAINKMQNDVSGVHYEMEKSENDLRGLLNKLRDDVDAKLLELLGAVQGVEHSKNMMERQVAEAGRILSNIAITTASANVDSPVPLKLARLDNQRATVNGNERAREDVQPAPSPTGSPRNYKASLAQGAICSCDDDIF